MAYISPSNKTTGTLITATEWNQSIVANQQAGAPDVFTRNGDLFVGTAADKGVRMAAGFGGQILETEYAATPALSWGGRVEGLQIGTTSDRWYQPGGFNVDRGNGLAGHFQAGCQEIVIGSGALSGSVTITYPVAFSYAPLIFTQPGSVYSVGSAVTMLAWPVNGTSPTQAVLQMIRTGTAGTIIGTVTVGWLAVGPFGIDGAYP